MSFFTTFMSNGVSFCGFSKVALLDTSTVISKITSITIQYANKHYSNQLKKTKHAKLRRLALKYGGFIPKVTRNKYNYIFPKEFDTRGQAHLTEFDSLSRGLIPNEPDAPRMFRYVGSGQQFNSHKNKHIGALVPHPTYNFPTKIHPVMDKKLQAWVLNMAAEPISIIDLDPRIFGVVPRLDIIHSVYNQERISRKPFPPQILGLNEQKGGNKRPHRTKGTGRARLRSRLSVLVYNGAVVGGPKPFDKSKLRNPMQFYQALFSVLTIKYSQNELFFVDKLFSPTSSQDEFMNLIEGFDITPDTPTIFIGGEKLLEELDEAHTDILEVDIVPASGIRIENLMDNRRIVMSLDALSYITKKADPYLW